MNFVSLKVVAAHDERNAIYTSGNGVTFIRTVNPSHVKWVESREGKVLVRLTGGETLEVVGDAADIAKRLAIAADPRA